jgi:Grx4 family monothiol glutaredoxin
MSSSSIPSMTTPPPVDSKAVLFFWAPWHEASAPGGPFDQALQVLSKTLSTIIFGKVEAEACVDLSEQYGVTVVPTVVLLNKGGVVVDKVQGEDVAAVTTAIQRLANMDDSSSESSSIPAPLPTEKESLSDRLNRLIRANQVMLFMKGTPTAPKCGFSRQAVELLSDAGIQFGSFDILSDEEVRQGLKQHSNWPTYPQIYVNGELIGGLDILKELAEEDGGLREQLGITSEQSKQETLNDRLKVLVNRHKVMLFMKGLPSAPKCGFSRQMCELLDGVAYDSFNILEDDEVRQGLKTFADWPTYPMLWVNGELVGGLDICKEMAESGDLQDLLQS